jgi:hypothetical protein
LGDRGKKYLVRQHKLCNSHKMQSGSIDIMVLMNNLKTVLCVCKCFLNVVPPEDDALRHQNMLGFV